VHNLTNGDATRSLTGWSS